MRVYKAFDQHIDLDHVLAISSWDLDPERSIDRWDYPRGSPPRVAVCQLTLAFRDKPMWLWSTMPEEPVETEEMVAGLRAQYDALVKEWSPQSPTAPAGEDAAARPVQLVTPGESILDAYERARQSYETASPARVDYDLRKAEFQSLRVGLVSCLQRVGLIDALRAGEGDSVTIFCDNADFGGPDNAVEVSGQWTEWEDRRFEGATLNQALTKALLAKGQADAKG